MLKSDGLVAIFHEVQTMGEVAVRDFHSLLAFRVTQLVRSKAPLAVIKSVTRLSSEGLVETYTKLANSDVSACVNSIRLPVKAIVLHI